MSDTASFLIQILKEQCLHRGFGGIRGLAVVFRCMDLDCSRALVFDELKIGLEKFGLRMSDNYLHTLFDSMDKDKNGEIDFLEFMKALRNPLTNKRTEVVNEAFDKLDTNGDGVIDVEDLKVFYTANAKNHPKYVSGEWTLEQTLRSFLDSIDSPDDPDGIVTREEFLDYYAGVSATIDDDSYFIMMMRSCYGLPQRKEMADKGRQLIDEMREICLSKGCGGIKLLSVIFRHMDTDFSKRLSRTEFKQGMASFGMRELQDKDVEILFQFFDKDENDTIDFDEFFRRLRPSLKKSRESTVNEAFEKMDVNHDGVLKTDDLKVFYAANATNHPKYISGEWTLEQTLRSFLDSIDSPDDPDGIVTREEFLDYYAGVSATIDEDSYFIMMMRSCYGLPQR